MVSQKSMTIAPIRITAGTSILWSVVLKNWRVKCGIARPIKAIGPANAVMLPGSKLVAIIITKRLFLRFNPRLVA